jgi:hypothetical protein
MLRDALSGCLHRLTPHLDVARVALTGGVAIGLRCDSDDGPRGRLDTAEDIDLVAACPDGVRPTVGTDFLISHFHRPQPGYPKFLIQLVDPMARLRVDVFPDSLHALSRASVCDVAGIPMQVLQANDILDHKITLLSGASPTKPIDPKHYADAKLLGHACGRDVPADLASHLAHDAYSRDLDAPCARCDASRCDEFPLASKRAIFDVLGYV